MSEHAPLAASASPQWGHCSGSVPAQANIPDTESEQSREGTAAHWVGTETLLNHVEPSRGGPLVCEGYNGRKSPNGVLIDDKMVEGAQMLVDDVLEVAERFDAVPYLLIEHRVYMPNIHPHNWGTLDVGLYLPDRNLLFLWDYKHGHREAKPTSLQMIDYLNGLAEKYQIDGRLDQQTRFVSRIVQPFCYYAAGPVREWSGFMSELRGEWNHLAMKAHEVFNGPTLTTGEWCRDCTAVGTCSAARRAGYNFIDLVNEPYAMDSMTGADLAIERGVLRDGLAVAKARLEAIEDELHHRVKAGETDSGLTVETSAGRLEWAVPPGQARALASQFGVDASKDAVLTPAQTLAAAPAKIRPLMKQIMDGMTRRPAGALKLVTADASRTARAFKRKE